MEAQHATFLMNKDLRKNLGMVVWLIFTNEIYRY